MKNTSITLVLLFIAITSIHAQTELNEETTPAFNWENSNIKGSAVIGAFGEIIYTKVVKEEKEKKYFSRADKLPQNFSGYSVQIIATMEPLSPKDNLFSKYGGVMVEETLNPKYCYLLGKFKTLQGAKKYLTSVVQYNFPNAKIIKYKDGKRIDVK